MARDTSVLTRLAHNVQACVVDEGLDRPDGRSQLIARVAKERTRLESIMLDLLLCSGVRVSEVVGLTKERVLSPRTALILGVKGSADRIVTLNYSVGFDALSDADWWRWENQVNRWHLYRLCKEYGVYEQVLGNRKLAVTHLGRHEFVAELERQGLTPEQIQKLIGHRSQKSTQWYLTHKPVR